MAKYNKVREGMYNLGEFKDGNIKTLLIVNFNQGELVFNNSNLGNAGTWTEHIKISEISKECCKPIVKFKNEKWYQTWKAFIASGIATEDYNIMVEKMNMGLLS